MPTTEIELTPEMVEDIKERISNNLSIKIAEEVRNVVHETIKEQAAEQASKVMTEALETPIYRTSRFGEVLGKAMPLKDLIRAEAMAWLGAERGRNHNFYKTNLGNYLEETVQKQMKSAVDSELKTAIEGIKDGVSKELAKFIKERLFPYSVRVK